MTYQPGSLIVANDYNRFLTTVNGVYGVGSGDRGYGQTIIAQSPVAGGDLVLSRHWLNLHDMIVVCAHHQGTAVPGLPSDSVFAAGQRINAHSTVLAAWMFMANQNTANDALGGAGSSNDMVLYTTEIDTNRLTAPLTSLSVMANVWSMTQPTAWTGLMVSEVSLFWSSEDLARYYFNSGGQIRLRGSHPTGTTANNIWNIRLQQLGTLSFGAHATGSSGALGGSEIGFYELADSYQNIYASDDEIRPNWEFMADKNNADEPLGAFSPDVFNALAVSARRLGHVGERAGNGLGIQFRIALRDNASLMAGTSFVFDNVMASTFLSGIIAPSYGSMPILAGWEFRTDINGADQALCGVNSMWEFEVDVNGSDEALGGLRD